MTVTVDWINKVVESTASIPDILAFKDTLRDFEDDAIGMVHDPIITYKKLSLGGGGFFHAVDFINGYQLKFPNVGNYSIIGNIGATIIPVAGVFVDRTTSASFASFASGSGVTAQDKIDISALVWAESVRTLTSSSPGAITPQDIADISTSVWVEGSRTLTQPVGLLSDERTKLLSVPTKEENADAVSRYVR